MRNKLYWFLALAIPSVALSLLLAHEVKVAKSPGFPLDDAWIFWVFAKNLATGQGFSFNPGEPVLGSTSILWVLVLAGSYLVIHSAVFISKFWGVVFFALSILLTFRICLFHTRQRRVALLSVLSIALAPPLVYGALSGMEIALATFLMCLTLFFHLKERGKAGKFFLAPIFGALCFSARPELVIFYPLLLVDDYTWTREHKVPPSGQSALSAVLRRLFLFVVFLCPHFIFTYAVTGSLLPNTFDAKALDSGIIWAIQNGNLGELAISLTLNPFVWGGSILITLIVLNVFWAFFWTKGLVLSFLKRETLIYPLAFLLIPILRGIVAPVGNSISANQRYVSFLFPFLSIFFVIGWEGLGQTTMAKRFKVSLRRWFFYLGGAALISAFIFYLNPLVGKDEIFRFLWGFYFPSIQAKSSYLNFPDFRFIFCFAVVFIAGVGLLGTAGYSVRRPTGKKIFSLLLILGMLLQVGFLANWAQRYALSVRNINQMQVQFGKWMNQNIPKQSLVAIHDVGAIKFFGERKCLDLEGLVSPQIIPYKIMGTDSYVVYLNKHRPDYFIVFPTYYPTVVKVLRLQQGILHQITLERDIASGGGGVMIAARPDWEFFDSTLQNSGLLDVEPYIPTKSFKRRWFDAQERQGIFPAWRVYEMKGREAERRQRPREADSFYRKAASYDPQHDEFYWHLVGFYKRIGDNAHAETAFEKAMGCQLFPPR
jgi:hypothetical protein